MDVYAHVAQYAAIALHVLHAHLVSLVLLLDQQNAQYVDATIVCAVLNAILFHANAAQNAQVILVNAAQYANHILADVVQYVIAVLVYAVVNVVAHAVAVQDLVLLFAMILAANGVRHGIVHLSNIAFEIEFKYLIFFLELHIM